MTSTCQSCDAAVAASDRFCGECGIAIAREKPLGKSNLSDTHAKPSAIHGLASVAGYHFTIAALCLYIGPGLYRSLFGDSDLQFDNIDELFYGLNSLIFIGDSDYFWGMNGSWVLTFVLALFAIFVIGENYALKHFEKMPELHGAIVPQICALALGMVFGTLLAMEPTYSFLYETLGLTEDYTGTLLLLLTTACSAASAVLFLKNRRTRSRLDQVQG